MTGVGRRIGALLAAATIGLAATGCDLADRDQPIWKSEADCLQANPDADHCSFVMCDVDCPSDFEEQWLPQPRPPREEPLPERDRPEDPQLEVPGAVDLRATVDAEGLTVVTERGLVAAGIGAAYRNVQVEAVSEVASEPCRGAAWFDPGSSATDLVEALTSRPDRPATREVAAVVAGYAATRFDLGAPAGLREGDCVPGGYVGWRTGSGLPHGFSAGQVTRVWVLDVDGQRVLVSATRGPAASPAEWSAMLRVVRSLQLVPAGATSS